MVANTKPIDFEAFLARPENRDRSFELINGEIVEKMPTGTHSFIQALIARVFANYFHIHRIGWAFTEFRIKLADQKGYDVIPDVVALLSANRIFPGDEPLPYMPEIVVEIKSPDDRLMEMREKARFYLANGVKIVWLVHPEKRLVYVLTPNSDDTMDENDVLDGGDVLPDFQVSVKEILPEV